MSSTCDWIQQMYGITNPTLVANNPQIDDKCENIYVGEVLCVDTDDYVYPEVNQTIYQVSPRFKSLGLPSVCVCIIDTIRLLLGPTSHGVTRSRFI